MLTLRPLENSDSEVDFSIPSTWIFPLRQMIKVPSTDFVRLKDELLKLSITKPITASLSPGSTSKN